MQLTYNKPVAAHKNPRRQPIRNARDLTSCNSVMWFYLAVAPFSLRYNQRFCMSVTTLQDKLTSIGAALGSYRGADTPASFGNTHAEFRALLEGCGLFDMSWQAKLVLTGEDRVRWLNGMVTNNIRDLGWGTGLYNFLLNAQGRILGDLVAYNRGDHLLVTTDRGQLTAIAETFDRYIIMDDVEVADISDKLSTVGLAGPHAAETMQTAGIGSHLDSGQVVNLTWRDMGISVARGIHPNMDGYEIWFAAEQADAVWDALVAAGATPVGSEALELYRIVRGVPRYGLDLSQRDLPQETEQKHALNFSKGCYIGQEIVERIRARAILHRTFTGFLVEGDPPQSGTKVQADGKNIGEITSAARVPFPTGERSLALGYLRREFEAPGTAVQVGEQKVTVQSIPFKF
jgi:folate-binding protein YgfZ